MIGLEDRRHSMMNGVFPLLKCFMLGIFLLSSVAGCQRHEFTLNISGEDDVDGASVFVNGRLVGTLAKDGENQPRFSMAFPNGTLTVEVKKDGYVSFLEVITVASNSREQEVHAKLARDTTAEDKTNEAPSDQARPSSPPKLPVCPD